MAFPSKFTAFDKSILAKLHHLMLNPDEEISLQELVKHKQKRFSDLSELLQALDVLFILGVIEFNESNGLLKYVKRN